MNTLPWGVCQIDRLPFKWNGGFRCWLQLPAVCLCGQEPVHAAPCRQSSLPAVRSPEIATASSYTIYDFLVLNHPLPVSSGSTSTRGQKSTPTMVPNYEPSWQASRSSHLPRSGGIQPPIPMAGWAAGLSRTWRHDLGGGVGTTGKTRSTNRRAALRGQPCRSSGCKI